MFGSLVSPLVGMGNILISTGITFVISAIASTVCGVLAVRWKESVSDSAASSAC